MWRCLMTQIALLVREETENLTYKPPVVWIKQMGWEKQEEERPRDLLKGCPPALPVPEVTCIAEIIRLGSGKNV